MPDKERQLARSILAISHDSIVGNQQNSNAFWERIYEHYESFKPVVHWGAWSKWGVIKHEVSKFTGYYQQIKQMNKLGVSEADIIHMAKDLCHTKFAKNGEFTYEHCWSIAKDYSQWADGVTTTRQLASLKRKSVSLDHVFQEGTIDYVSVVDLVPKSNMFLRD